MNQREDLAFLGKDSHLFGQDLDLVLRDHNKSPLQVLSAYNGDYLLGDASVWYLYSESAAQELHNINPNCKIIICLRNPLKLIPSLHNQHLKGGDESVADLNTALESDFNGDSIPLGAHFKRRPRYLDSVAFDAQIKRFKDQFYDVHFVFHEDLKQNFGEVVNGIENFLGLDERQVVPKVEVNTRQDIKKPKLVNVLKRKPAFLKSVFRTVIPSKSLRHKIMTKAMDSAVETAHPENHMELSDKNGTIIRESIQKQLPFLKELTGRDCSHWLD